jgi:short-subunit dehydrogenase involved in D-alanine esterification of teichoic acids
VTGAGTGLGLVTAAALAENGARVYITGRRAEVLEQAAKSASPKHGRGSIIPVQADVSTKEGILSKSTLLVAAIKPSLIVNSRTELRKAVQEKDKWVNVLINRKCITQDSLGTVLRTCISIQMLGCRVAPPKSCAIPFSTLIGQPLALQNSHDTERNGTDA